MSPGPSPSDALSLTLPAASKSRARRRLPPIPPNWKFLLAMMTWDAFAILVCVLLVVTGISSWPVLFTAGGAAVDLQQVVRQWVRGGAVTPEQRRVSLYVGLPLYALGVLGAIVYALLTI